MLLAGEFVLFQLSPEGQQALAGLFPARFSAYVVHEDELGVWILTAMEAVSQTDPVETDKPGKAVPVTLLKRQYFSTAVVDIDAQTLAEMAVSSLG